MSPGSLQWEGRRYVLVHGRESTEVPIRRRQGLARKLMDLLEDVTHRLHDGYFVDLFVRQSNANAIGMYRKARPTLLTRHVGRMRTPFLHAGVATLVC